MSGGLKEGEALHKEVGEDHGSKVKCCGGGMCIYAHIHTQTYPSCISPIGGTLNALMLGDFMRHVPII